MRALMRTGAWVALLAALSSLGPGCSLDLDRLRAGAGGDGGGGEIDAALDARAPDPDGGARDDAGDPGEDAGTCECASGRWQAQTFVVGGAGVTAVVLRDLDGDGDADVVASLLGAPPALVRVGTGVCAPEAALSLEPPAYLDMPTGTIAGVAQLVGDPVLDVGIPHRSASALRVQAGSVSAGRYSASFVSSTGLDEVPRAMWSSPLAGDGVVGVVTGEAGATVLVSSGASHTTRFVRLTNPAQHAAIDATSDGGALLVVAEDASGVELVVLDAAGAELRRSSSPAPTSGPMVEVALGDLDADGDTDVLAISGGATGELHGYHSDGTDLGNAIPLGPTGVAHLALGDLRDEPGVEIALTDRTRADVQIGRSVGPGVVVGDMIAIAGVATAVAVADVDGDGRDDIVVGYANAGGTGEVAFLRRICF